MIHVGGPRPMHYVPKHVFLLRQAKVNVNVNEYVFSQIHVGKLINIHWICFTIPIIYEHVFLFQNTNYYFPHLNRRK